MGVTWVPKDDRRGAARLRQEDAVHIVFQGGRGELGQVIFWLVFVQQAGEFWPAHALGVGIDDLEEY